MCKQCLLDKYLELDLKPEATGNNSKCKIISTTSNQQQQLSPLFAPKVKIQFYEQHCFNVMFNIMKTFANQAQCPQVPITTIVQDVNLVFSSQEIMLILVTRFFSALPLFDNMNAQDQLTLLKASFPEIILYCMNINFNFEKDCFVVYMVSGF